MWLLMYDVHVVYVDVLLSSACCWYDTDVMCCVCLQWFQDMEESHPQQILLLMYALRRRTCAVDMMLMLCCVCVSAVVSRHGGKSSTADTAADVCITAWNLCCCYDADALLCVCVCSGFKTWSKVICSRYGCWCMHYGIELVLLLLIWCWCNVLCVSAAVSRRRGKSLAADAAVCWCIHDHVDLVLHGSHWGLPSSAMPSLSYCLVTVACRLNSVHSVL